MAYTEAEGFDKGSLHGSADYGFDAVTNLWLPMNVGKSNVATAIDTPALFVRSTIAQDAIRRGLRTGAAGWTKFAYREGLTAAAGEQTIWATSANTPALPTAATTFTITYTDATDGPSTTGAKVLTFFYVDANGNPAVGQHTLDGSSTDVTSFGGFGVNRVAVSESGSANSNGSDITITATTGGGTLAVVPAGGSVTQSSVFTNGGNHTAIVKNVFVNAIKPVGGDAIIKIKGYAFNRNVETQYEVFRGEIDTSVELTLPYIDPVGFNLSPSDVLYFVADTDTNGANVNIRYGLNQYQNS